MSTPADDSIQAQEPPGQAAPTQVRHLVVGLATLMAVLLYLDRLCLSFTERYIREDLRLTNTEASWLLSAFFWTYALGQVPSGWLSDRFGARKMLSLYILLWSLFTGWIGLVGSFLALLALRFGVGLAQAGAYPTSASLISKWVPFSARALASGIVSTGGRLGGVAAPLLTAYLMVLFVPLGVDSKLTGADLLDPGELCHRIEKEGTTPADQLAAALRRHLPPDARDVVRQMADGKLDPAQGEPVLLAGLNAVLQQPDLIKQVKVEDFELPREAASLAAIPSGEATAEQVERRNRLLLEAAFPEQIRKVYTHGWRPVMLVYGGVGLLVAGLFWLAVRDRPQDHPACNAAERELIESSLPASASKPTGKVGGVPMKYILRNFSLWCSSLSQFGTNFGWLFVVTLLPRYLVEVHRVPIQERGVMVGLPVIVGLTGMLLGGWLTDRLTQAVGLRWGRRLPMASTRFLAMAAYIACLPLGGSAWSVTMALCVVTIATDLGTAAVWAFKQDIGGRYVGSVLGWGNMWGNVGAALSPIVLNEVIEAYGWNGCFLSCAAAFLVAGVAALGVDSTKPIMPKEEEAEGNPFKQA